LVSFPTDVPFANRVDLVASSMLPSEQTVAAFLQQHPEVVAESKAQDLAELIGVARSTVIRTCQTLGYSGYTQLRLALVRESVPRDLQTVKPAEGLLGLAQARLLELGQAIPATASTLTEPQLREAVGTLANARRIVCAANGFSSSVAMDFAMRLAAMGLPAEFVADFVAQQFTAAHLTEKDVCVIVSASGQNESTLRVARVAKEAGAKIVALCSFPRSPLAELTDHLLIAVPPKHSFKSELEQTSRVAHVAVAEALAALVIEHAGAEVAQQRRARLIPVIGKNLVE